MVGQATEKVTVTLDRNAVGRVAYQTASEVSDIFSLAFTVIAGADVENIPTNPDQHMHFSLKTRGRSAAEQREAYQRRLVAMCFSDLARAIRETLETACAHMELLKTPPETLAGGSPDEVLERVVARMEAIRPSAQALNYPQLLKRVQDGLSAPLTWTPELHSFQTVRNCLEHRGGVVGERDVDQNGQLTLSLPTVELYHLDAEGNETAMHFDAPTQKETQVMLRTITRTQTFNLGQTVSIPPRDVKEVAFAVLMLAGDLVAKMPASDRQEI